MVLKEMLRFALLFAFLGKKTETGHNQPQNQPLETFNPLLICKF